MPIRMQPVLGCVAEGVVTRTMSKFSVSQNETKQPLLVIVAGRSCPAAVKHEL